jgi:hypothetical protein
MEDRLTFLEQEFNNFDYIINPYHMQPGILLDVNITSIKRKKSTLDAMANVLNEFLSGVSKGFSDAAFASFSRRRSTVREDLAQTFSATPDDEGDGTAVKVTALPANTKPGQDYVDIINGGAASAAPAQIEAPRRGRRPAGAVDAAAGRGRGRGRAAGSTGTGRGRGRRSQAADDGLKEL